LNKANLEFAFSNERRISSEKNNTLFYKNRECEVLRSYHNLITKNKTKLRIDACYSYLVKLEEVILTETSRSDSMPLEKK